jgi:hypothetical protein
MVTTTYTIASTAMRLAATKTYAAVSTVSVVKMPVATSLAALRYEGLAFGFEKSVREEVGMGATLWSRRSCYCWLP